MEQFIKEQYIKCIHDIDSNYKLSYKQKIFMIKQISINKPFTLYQIINNVIIEIYTGIILFSSIITCHIYIVEENYYIFKKLSYDVSALFDIYSSDPFEQLKSIFNNCIKIYVESYGQYENYTKLIAIKTIKTMGSITVYKKNDLVNCCNNIIENKYKHKHKFIDIDELNKIVSNINIKFQSIEITGSTIYNIIHFYKWAEQMMPKCLNKLFCRCTPEECVNIINNILLTEKSFISNFSFID